MTPLPGSLVSTRSSFSAASAVPSATVTCPAWMERPIPTPPPWWIETHEAPEAVLSSAFKSGQSAMASEPSRMPSVSRYGEATDPQSRWSRPITIGALQRAVGDHVVEAQSQPVALAVAEPADPRRQALEVHPFAGHPDPAAERLVVRELGEHRLVGRPRCPAGHPTAPPSGTGPLPWQNSGRMYAGTKPGKSKARSQPPVFASARIELP